MMDWLSEDINRGQFVLTCIAILITAIIIWLLRRKLVIAIPCALVFFLCAATTISSFIPARNTAYRNTCINNLEQIKKAKEEWARQNHKLPIDVPREEDLYGTNGFLKRKIGCPLGGQYTLGAMNQNPACTLSNKGHFLK